MDAESCVEALKDALAKHGTPEIFNIDQGSQFTSGDWIDVLTDAKIKISMDGKECWIDNWMIERLWRSLKYECVYCMPSRRAQRPSPASVNGWFITMSKGPTRHTVSCPPTSSMPAKQNQ